MDFSTLAFPGIKTLLACSLMFSFCIRHRKCLLFITTSSISFSVPSGYFQSLLISYFTFSCLQRIYFSSFLQPVCIVKTKPCHLHIQNHQYITIRLNETIVHQMFPNFGKMLSPLYAWASCNHVSVSTTYFLKQLPSSL